MKNYKINFRFAAVMLLVGTVVGQSLLVRAETGQVTCKPASDAFCYGPQVAAHLDRIDTVQMPKIATPSWLTAQATPAPSAARQVAYTVETKGNVTVDAQEFASQVNQTLNSSQGWARLGVSFVQVQTGGEFIVWLSEASEVANFSPGCDAIVSCTVGNNVIINQTRWLNGSDAWNGAGGDLRGYRHMVVNHEVGHWLGHGHEYCSGPGQPAPIMQQQTIDMQGCKPNPWPQSHEVYAPKLGIRS